MDIRRDVDGEESVSGSYDGEVVEEVVRVPWESSTYGCSSIGNGSRNVAEHGEC